MKPELQLELGGADIARLSSVYIDEGTKRDAWKIGQIKIQDHLLTATVQMRSFFVSPTDPGGFHLTIFSTQEFLAQLSNIYLHLLAGYRTKERETWMSESSIAAKSPIRNPENISVEMEFFSVKRLRESIFAKAKCRVFDAAGGLFTAELKGMLR